ncbi:MAG: helix-turn-helix domain-containing protein [Acidobacteriota bacterium]
MSAAISLSLVANSFNESGRTPGHATSIVDIARGVNDNDPTDSAIAEESVHERHNASGRSTSRRIVFLAFPQVALLDLTGPWEVFSLANTLRGGEAPPYDLELVSGDGSATILSVGGISMESHRAARKCRGAIDTLIVPAADLTWATKSPAGPSKVLRRLAGRSRRIVSICAGAFLLAAAGLLDGKKATTHWRGAEELSTRFPQVDVQADSIFVKDGNTYTSAGVTAGIDLALALVEEDLGRAMALDCARHLVVFMRRPGGQSQFSATLESQRVERNSINELIAWAADNPSSDLSVEAMSERVHMSLRNFSRVFRREVGQTPAAFVERLRVEAVRRLLEETDQSLNAIATRCGFGSADSMRRSFYRVVKVAPSDYRQRFS